MLTAVLICVALITYSKAFSESDDALTSESSDGNEQCEAEWFYFREKCYRAWGQRPRTFEKLNWDEALNRCTSYGGNLVSIHSQEEQEFLNYFLRLEESRTWIWIGLHDVHSEGNFEWSDGSALNFTNWNRGEPSGEHSGNGEEDCVNMVSNSGVTGKWNDRTCFDPGTYICEKSANMQNSDFVEEDECASRVEAVKILTGVSVCFFLVIILLSFVLYDIQRCSFGCRKPSTKPSTKSRSTNRPGVLSTVEHPLKENEITILDL